MDEATAQAMLAAVEMYGHGNAVRLDSLNYVAQQLFTVAYAGAYAASFLCGCAAWLVLLKARDEQEFF